MGGCAVNWKNRIILLFRIVLGIVFLCAAVPKIISPYGFAEAVYRYQAAPYFMVNITAIFLPWVELVSGLCLLFSKTFRAASSLVVLGLMIFFTALVSVTVFRGIDISCGCFSVNPDAASIGWKKIAENTLMTVMAVFVFLDALKPPFTAHSAR